MIEKLEQNTKIKLISLLSAIVLWMYVMAVVDPEETKVFENIPINITNMNEILNNDYVIYPDISLAKDVYITGKLSLVQNISKNDINIYGTINNPIEGNNAVYLKAITSKGVQYEFKQDTIIVPLDKVIDEKRSIDIVVDGKYKNNVDNITLDNESIEISGPRTLVQQVQKVQATLTLDNNKNDFSTKLQLIPIDDKGKKVEGVNLENSTVNVNVKLLVDKSVTINPVFKGTYDNIEQYQLSQNNINIKGKRDVVEGITSINTKPIDLSDISNGQVKDIELDIPNGITIDNDNKVTIKVTTTSEVNSSFNYTKDDIEVRNNNDNIDLSTLNIPNDINVNISYENTISDLKKSDITLYIDLSSEETSYKIKYESQYDFDRVIITPDIVTKS
ncbi:MAG: hypothetical protein IJH34_01180 [Romboutsia sp.]|nr:hypothetical protein [Romboutsia sp.]